MGKEPDESNSTEKPCVRCGGERFQYIEIWSKESFSSKRLGIFAIACVGAYLLSLTYANFIKSRHGLLELAPFLVAYYVLRWGFLYVFSGGTKRCLKCLEYTPAELAGPVARNGLSILVTGSLRIMTFFSGLLLLHDLALIEGIWALGVGAALTAALFALGFKPLGLGLDREVVDTFTTVMFACLFAQLPALFAQLPGLLGESPDKAASVVGLVIVFGPLVCRKFATARQP